MAKIQLNIVNNFIEDVRYDNAVKEIAECYKNEKYDEYEDLIAYYASIFGLNENFIEDAAIDYYYGFDC